MTLTTIIAYIVSLLLSILGIGYIVAFLQSQPAKYYLLFNATTFLVLGLFYYVNADVGRILDKYGF